MTKNILMVGNFSSSTGYAWNMIGLCFKAIGIKFVKNGHIAIVCYPKLDCVPEYYNGSGIKVVEYDFWGSKKRMLYKYIRDNDIKIVYLIDRPSFSLRYAALRLGGVKSIVVHDHTSGERTIPGGFRKILKTFLNNIWLFSADKIIAISEYVNMRQINVSCVSSKKVTTIHNGLDIAEYVEGNGIDINRLYGIPVNKKIIYCCGRANIYKGIHIFIKAADVLINNRKREDLFFIYSGDGSYMEEYRKMVNMYNLNHVFLFTGHVNFIKKILAGVNICIVPSIWQEGFGLVVIEAMAAGVPVIASKVGGMAEIIEDRSDGFYVEPGDYNTIADLVETLVDDDIMYKKISIAARYKAYSKYDIKYQYEKLLKVIYELN